MAYGSWHTALPYTTMFTNQPPWPTAVGVHQQRLGPTVVKPRRLVLTFVVHNGMLILFFKKIKL
jgi:hypothetical protein